MLPPCYFKITRQKNTMKSYKLLILVGLAILSLLPGCGNNGENANSYDTDTYKGWKIRSAEVIGRAAEVTTVNEIVKPKRGVFLLVKVSYSMAGDQTPKENLVLGKDSSLIIDCDGNEFPAEGFALSGTKQGKAAFLLLPGGYSLEGPAEQDEIYDNLICFDVPKTSYGFLLKVEPEAPAVRVRGAGQDTPNP